MVTENSCKKVVKQGFQTKKGGLGKIIFFKTCLVNLISTLVVLYGTIHVSKKGIVVNNTDHSTNTCLIK